VLVVVLTILFGAVYCGTVFVVTVVVLGATYCGVVDVAEEVVFVGSPLLTTPVEVVFLGNCVFVSLTTEVLVELTLPFVPVTLVFVKLVPASFLPLLTELLMFAVPVVLTLAGTVVFLSAGRL
jgi:hypothetical protein